MKPSRRRPLVDYLRDQYRASERHACQILRLVRGTYRYKSHQKEWIELAGANPRDRAEPGLIWVQEDSWCC